MHEYDSVSILLGKGANPNYQDENRRTALHFLVNSFHIELIQKLVEKGANESIQDKDGKTPYSACLTQCNEC
jgi:ankyrin repeat protein